MTFVISIPIPIPMPRFQCRGLQMAIKEIDRLLGKVMSNIYLKITIEKKFILKTSFF